MAKSYRPHCLLSVLTVLSVLSIAVPLSIATADAGALSADSEHSAKAPAGGRPTATTPEARALLLKLNAQEDPTFEALDFFAPSRLTVEERGLGQTGLHGYNENLINRIISPNRARGEFILQRPVLAQYPLRETGRMTLAEAERTGPKNFDLVTEYYKRYGLHPEVTNSYWEDVPSSFITISSRRSGTHRLGVTPNCYSCHSGRVGGTLILGLGNQRIDYRGFFNDLNPHKNVLDLARGYRTAGNVAPMIAEPLKHGSVPQAYYRMKLILDMMDFVKNLDAQSPTAGTSDPWSIAVQLFQWRDNDMNYINATSGRGLKQEPVVIDPMPWWLLKYKKSINWDGIITKGPRTIVQGSFAPGNNGKYVRENERLFIELYEEAQRMDSPRYPQEKNPVQDPAVREKMVLRGEKIFNNNNCWKCHGVHSRSEYVGGNKLSQPLRHYFRDPSEFNFPNMVVPAAGMGLDSARAQRVNLDYVRQLEKSWIGYYAGDDRSQTYLERLKKSSGPGIDTFGCDKDALWRIIPQLKTDVDAKSDTTITAALSPDFKFSPVALYYQWREKCGAGNNFKFNFDNYEKRRGYLAPPLWGVALSAPYMHNGSIPTLTQYLEMEPRAALWRLAPVNSVSVRYDYEKVGLALGSVGQVDGHVYDVSRLGHSNGGHEEDFRRMGVARSWLKDLDPNRYAIVRNTVVYKDRPDVPVPAREILKPMTEREMAYGVYLEMPSERSKDWVFVGMSLEDKRDLLEYLKTL